MPTLLVGGRALGLGYHPGPPPPGYVRRILRADQVTVVDSTRSTASSIVPLATSPSAKSLRRMWKVKFLGRMASQKVLYKCYCTMYRSCTRCKASSGKFGGTFPKHGAKCIDLTPRATCIDLTEDDMPRRAGLPEGCIDLTSSPDMGGVTASGDNDLDETVLDDLWEVLFLQGVSP